MSLKHTFGPGRPILCFNRSQQEFGGQRPTEGGRREACGRENRCLVSPRPKNSHADTDGEDPDQAVAAKKHEGTTAGLSYNHYYSAIGDGRLDVDTWRKTLYGSLEKLLGQ